MRKAAGGLLALGHVDHERANALAPHVNGHHPLAGRGKEEIAVVAGDPRNGWLARKSGDLIPRPLKLIGRCRVPREGDVPLGAVPEAKRKAVPTARPAQRHGRA